MASQNHNIIILNDILVFYLNTFLWGQKFSLIKESYFYCFQNIWENLGKLSGHIYSIYMSLSTWSCSKYWAKPFKTSSAYFKLMEYFYKKYSQ